MDKDSHLIFERYINNEPVNEGLKDVLAAGALGLASMAGPDKDVQAGPQSITPKEYSISESPIQDNSFINYMKNVENGVMAGWDKQQGKWFPHKSAEGGRPTIGYGHKIKPGENFSNGLTDKQALEYLFADLKDAENKARSQFDDTFGTGSFDKLDNKRKQMLMDFTFNLIGGLKGFPKFTKGVHDNNLPVMKKEYIRKYLPAGKERKPENYLPVKDRNEKFAAYFLGGISEQPVKRNKEENVIIVKSGDTMIDLEKSFRLPYGSLQKANPNIDPRKMRPGQQLKLPN